MTDKKCIVISVDCLVFIRVAYLLFSSYYYYLENIKLLTCHVFRFAQFKCMGCLYVLLN